MIKRGFFRKDQGRLSKIVFILTVILVQFIAVQGAFAQACSSGSSAECPATTGTAIAAAFASEAYFVMADIVHQIANTDFGLWAPLLYVLSAFAGLFMMVLGAPPRNYVWFMIGPGIYSWLLFTYHPAQGVAWAVAGAPQRQEIVWRMAEVGIENTNYARRTGLTMDKEQGPSDVAQLPMVFLWFDEVVSAQVQWFMTWAGVYQKVASSGGATNRQQAPGSSNNDAWHILSNSKWPMLENITAAAIHNPDARDAFVEFLASECGDVMAEYMDKDAYSNAANAKGKGLNDIDIYSNTETFQKDLASVIIPIPNSVISLTKEPVTVSAGTDFRTFVNNSRDPLPSDNEWQAISCFDYFFLIVEAFRFETAQTYNQVLSEASDYEIDEGNILYDFLYGWNLDGANNLDIASQRLYIQSLILFHMMRNELALAPTPVNPRYSASERNIQYSEAYQRNIGSKNKYGELYTWAKMMPYIQGVLLYVVTIAYPFCCILMVIPGWHKIMFTWMSFFAWAKSWDAGFAIVMSIERGVWATVGNTTDAEGVNTRVMNSGNIPMEISCGGGGGAAGGDVLGCSDVFIGSSTGEALQWDEAFEIWNTAMVLSSNLDFDLKNSFYIYVMSALYFAVPAVTGQILLGAKSGASGMISNAVGGVASSAGNAVGQAVGGEVNVRGSTIGATVGQAAFKKAMRGSTQGAGFLGQAYDSQLAQNAADLNASAAGHQEKAYGMQMGRNADQNSVAKGDTGVRQSAIGGGANSALDIWKNSRGFPGGNRSVSSAPGTGAGGTGNGGLNPLGHGALVGASYLSNVGGAARNRDLDSDLAEQNAGLRQQQLGQSALGFQQSMMGRGYGAMSGRYRDAAQQAAGEAQWTAMRNWSNSVQGKASALGVFSGAFGPGQKPTQVDGMLGLGMLGYGGSGMSSYKSGKKRFNNLDPNDSWGASVNGAKSRLHGGNGSWGGVQYNRPDTGFGLIGRGATAAPTEMGQEFSSGFTDGARDWAQGVARDVDGLGKDYFSSQN